MLFNYLYFYFKAVVRFHELAEGGALWFPNLTDVDPTMCLSLILCLTNLLIIEVMTYLNNFTFKKISSKLFIYK